MNREQAVEIIERHIDNNIASGSLVEQALSMAIDALNAQLSKEGTTSDLISKTEVVKHLRRMLEATVPNTDYDEGYVDGVEFGVSTVSTMPSMQPVATDTNVGDTISRQALCEYALNQKDKSVTPNDIMRFPSVQPEPHEGRFERKQDGVFCSVCHYGWEFITGVPAEVEREYHYCPNCGADMRGEKDG